MRSTDPGFTTSPDTTFTCERSPEPAMSKKNRRYTTANPAYAAAMRGLRGSSAAQRHTPRPRKGTRAQKQRQALRDQRGE